MATLAPTIPPEDLEERFAALSYSGKQRHVLPIEAAKTPETRQRRIAGAIAALKE